MGALLCGTAYAPLRWCRWKQVCMFVTQIGARRYVCGGLGVDGACFGNTPGFWMSTCCNGLLCVRSARAQDYTTAGRQALCRFQFGTLAQLYMQNVPRRRLHCTSVVRIGCLHSSLQHMCLLGHTTRRDASLAAYHRERATSAVQFKVTHVYVQVPVTLWQQPRLALLHSARTRVQEFELRHVQRQRPALAACYPAHML